MGEPVVSGAVPPGAGQLTFFRKLVASLREDIPYAVFSFWVNTLAASDVVPRALRLVMLRMTGMKIGVTQVYARTTFTSNKFTAGREVGLNRDCQFENGAGVVFGDFVRVGPGAMFCTSGHKLGAPGLRAGPLDNRPIVVGDGVWIGARATLLGGVTVAPGCVIAAGAVVTKSTEPNGLYGGVPARRLRDLNP